MNPTQPTHRTSPPSGRYPTAKPTPGPVDTADRQAKIRRAIEAARQKAVQAVSSYVSVETRDEWVEQRTPLWLHKCGSTAGKFGQRWLLLVSAHGVDAPRATLTMPANDYRDVFFGEMARIITVAGPVGPLMLKSYETDKGNPGYDLIEWVNEDGELDPEGELFGPIEEEPEGLPF